MNRRTFLLSVAAPLSAALVLAACGEDGGSGTDRTDATTTIPPTIPPTTDSPTTLPPTTAAPGTITHPTGAADVVLRLAVEGGFVPADFLFVRLPQVLVTGDGSVYTQGAQIEIYPQPLLPPVLVGRISEERLQVLLRAASDAGLFRTIEYGPPSNGIADAPDTVLTLNVNGTSYTHTAYALGMMGDAETDADRKAFAAYVALLDALAVEDLGSQPYAAERFAIRALPADEAPPPDGIVPDEVDWPAGAGVALADAADCAVVEGPAVGGLFTAATQVTRFVDGGTKYVLLVRPVLPGDPGC